tara:strand:- start:21048 stop:21332 length:285 start_codon:yes stop_codon:yes gene_type:complete
MRAYLITLAFISGIFTVIQPAYSEEAILPVEPEITIRREADETFYEYRVNGIIKEIKVVPSVGPTYYLVPEDGNAWIREERSQVLVPSWVLFKW